ncbi:hypothetical protein AMECASPLE_005051, partial [Ameca splendens]
HLKECMTIPLVLQGSTAHTFRNQSSPREASTSERRKLQPMFGNVPPRRRFSRRKNDRLENTQCWTHISAPRRKIFIRTERTT